METLSFFEDLCNWKKIPNSNFQTITNSWLVEQLIRGNYYIPDIIIGRTGHVFVVVFQPLD